MDNSLNLAIGERYKFRGSIYEITSILDSKIQLRGLHRSKEIIFQNLEKLVIAHRKGSFNKVQEAPLLKSADRVIAALPSKVRTKVERKLYYVTNIMENLQGHLPVEATNNLAEKLAANINEKAPCYISLYNWINRFLDSNCDPTALIPRRNRRAIPRIKRQPQIVQDIINYNIDNYYLSKFHWPISCIIDSIQLSIEDLNSMRPVVDKLKCPSNTTLYRIITEFDRYTTVRLQEGKKAADDDQYWSRKCTNPYRLLDIAECDSQQLDIEIVDNYGDPCGRPYLTVILEIKSRVIIGWDISLNAPSLEKTFRAIKLSLRSNSEQAGLCARYVLDNGPEFIAEHYKRVMNSLGAECTFCEPNNPDQKPHVESFFKTYSQSIVHHMRGTTFSNAAEKGGYNSQKDAIYTLLDVNELFVDWLEMIYHSQPHSGLLNKSPFETWESLILKGFPPKKYDQDELKRYFAKAVFVTPSNGRVRYSNVSWTGPAVAYFANLNHNKKKTKSLKLIYDPSDLGVAWVYNPFDPEDLRQVEAVDPDYQDGLTMHMHRIVQAEIRSRGNSFSYREAKREKVAIMEKVSAKNKSSRKRSKDTEQKTLPSKAKSRGVNTRAAKQTDLHPNTPNLDDVMELQNERFREASNP